ncbi:MAG: hypothetical protein HKN82_11565 [Akkermansiaceae bacterium]|nr:hypothetical protein [Akkermansiaceae bacterium]NNM31407.1 hypothetical protein [Akkermansiaceae bacterium]
MPSTLPATPAPRFRRWFLPGLLALVLATPAGAQSRKISLRALCFQHVDDIHDVLLVTGTEDDPVTTPVRLFTSAYSDPVEVTVTGPRLVFAVQPGGPAGGDQLRIVAEAPLAAGARQMVIFLPSRKAGRPYELTVIDESEAAFPMGSTLIYNITSTSARFTIGEYGRELKPGAHGLIPLPKRTNSLNQCTVRVFLADRDGAWQAVSSTVWKTSPKLRSLALTYIHPRTMQPTVHCFQETPPWRLPKL